MRGRKRLTVGNRIEPEHAHLTRVGLAVALEDLDRGRLARAVRPEQSEHLSPADLEVEAGHRDRRAVALLEPRNSDCPANSILLVAQSIVAALPAQ